MAVELRVASVPGWRGTVRCVPMRPDAPRCAPAPSAPVPTRPLSAIRTTGSGLPTLGTMCTLPDSSRFVKNPMGRKMMLQCLQSVVDGVRLRSVSVPPSVICQRGMICAGNSSASRRTRSYKFRTEKGLHVPVLKALCRFLLCLLLWGTVGRNLIRRRAQGNVWSASSWFLLNPRQPPRRSGVRDAPARCGQNSPPVCGGIGA